MSNKKPTCGSNMKIYGSTDYIHEPKVGDLKLRVNSQWDFKARDVCFGYAGDTLIAYNLFECTAIIDDRTTEWKEPKITKKIKDQLIAQDYTISKRV